MKLRKVFFCILGILACSAVSVIGLSCNTGERPYPPQSCLTFNTGTQVQASEANTNCDQGLVTFEEDEQFDTLFRYVEVLTQGSDRYWLGYMYNESDVLVSYSGAALSGQSPALNEDNYVTGVSQAPPMSGTCIAVGLDAENNVKLFRVTCVSILPYICSTVVSVPGIATISFSVSRFLTTGGTITITCNAPNKEEPFLWRRNGQDLTSDEPGLTFVDSNAEGSLTVDSFDGVTASYECVAISRAGRVVSQAVVLTNSVGVVDTAPIIHSIVAPNSAQFGTPVNVTCGFSTNNTIASIEWFINGVLQRQTDLSNSDTEDTLMIDSFSEDGVYQCRLRNDNGDTNIRDVTILGRAGTPGPVTFPIALPNSRTQLFLSWLYPENLNVLDPLLLRYQIYYQQGNNFNENTALTTEMIVPVLMNGQISPDGIIESALNGLSPGRLYTVSIRAHSTVSAGNLAGDLAVVSTYGTAPTKSVNNLKVLRTLDNKTLFANWDDLKLQAPEGPVARYLVQYRDSNKDDAINRVVLAPKYSYLVVTPVANAQDYQVRVSVGVVVKRDPLEYEYGPFTDWLVVQGVSPTVPPIPPTEGVLSVAGVIATAVIVPVLVLGMIALILMMGIVFFCLKRNTSKGPNYRKRADSQAVELQSKDKDTSATVSTVV